MNAPTVDIRPLEAGDLRRICAIEDALFPTPWSRAMFEEEISSHGPRFSWVAVRDGEVVAYMIAWLIDDELHIGNFAVAPEAQRAGIGRRLFSHILDGAHERGVVRATLEVRESNDRAQALYEQHGFIPVAMRKRYYSDSGEDAIVMLKTFDPEGAQ